MYIDTLVLFESLFSEFGKETPFSQAAVSATWKAIVDTESLAGRGALFMNDRFVDR